MVRSFAEAHCGAFCGWSVFEVGKDREEATCLVCSICLLRGSLKECLSEGEGEVPDACSVLSWNKEEGGECRFEVEGKIGVFVCERV